MSALHLDQWAPLNRFLDEATGIAAYPGIWVPPDDHRRIQSYAILKALVTNNLREVLPADDEGDRPALSEWGEAALTISRIVAGLLSRDLGFVVEGAEQPPPAMPPIPDPVPEPDRTDPTAVAAYDAAVNVRTEQAADIIADWEAQVSRHRAAVAWQTWLDQWIVDEQYLAKLGELEEEYVGPLGDGVLVHAWSPSVNRPTVRIVDPAEYFPVLDPDSNRWPTVVHLVWESDRRRGDGSIEERLHRITYRTTPIEGRTRSYPWNTGPSTATVTLSEWWWPKGDAGTWHNLDPTKASKPIDGTDMEIDFVPVVHIPNVAETVNHWGRSSLTNHVGLFEAIARHNHNIQLAGDLAAFPAFTSSGVQVPSVALAPGAVLNVGADGEIDPLELGPALEPLMKLGDWFVDRMAMLTEIGKPTLGVTTGGEGNVSGVKLRLQFGPFEQKIDKMRQVRAEKYALSLKQVMRLAQHGRIDVPTGPPPRVNVRFGSITPADVAQVVDEVSRLEGQVSRATVLAVLASAGYPIGDIEAELDRMDREDVEAALGITEATGNYEAAAARLGVEARAAVTFDPAASDGTG